VRNNEFVNPETKHFFMRTEFSGEFARTAVIGDLIKELPEDVRISLGGKKKKKIVLLATKEHHCLGDLLLRNEFDRINAEILAVISNHELLRSLTERFGIPYHFVPHEGLSREGHEEIMLEVIDGYKPEFLVLAKYMRILTPEFVRRFPNRIINIHHSFLPAFIGANPYKQAYTRGVKIIGATAHFVNTSLDEGPIIHQSIIPVDHTHSVNDMMQAGKDVEKTVLARALNLVFDERVFVDGNKTVIFD
ncbi:MAG TPA: formyltetrahydrofolate deformylase, partial [Spirochaetota bacterium]|nr:formyltetrahydrofolate deformylase [Spirochaetota bacterium]